MFGSILVVIILIQAVLAGRALLVSADKAMEAGHDTWLSFALSLFAVVQFLVSIIAAVAVLSIY